MTGMVRTDKFFNFQANFGLNQCKVYFVTHGTLLPDFDLFLTLVKSKVPAAQFNAAVIQIGGNDIDSVLHCFSLQS